MPGRLDSLRIMLLALGAEHPFGDFTVDGNDFSGKGTCGTLYEGSFRQAEDGGIDVRMTATIPKGTSIGSTEPTTEERRHEMSLHLTREQVEGTETARVELPGFGAARVRLDRG